MVVGCVTVDSRLERDFLSQRRMQEQTRETMQDNEAMETTETTRQHTTHIHVPHVETVVFL